MQTFTVHALHDDGRAFEQPIEATSRVEAVDCFQLAWPLASAWCVNDDPIAGYDAITGEVLFEDDEFTISYGDESEMLLKRTVDTTAEDAR